MKKKIVILLIMTLLFGVAFATPAQAEVNRAVLASYIQQQGGSAISSIWYSKNYPGSFKYWRVRTIEEQSWTGENRPEKLMGDANIDGRVDARDALVALYFGLYGNMQTDEILVFYKTSNIVKTQLKFQNRYQSGTLQKQINEPDFWCNYCKNNSPFFADVTKDCVVNSKDALLILQYSVGKAKDFPEGDFTTLNSKFFYYPWPTEYYPGFFSDLISDMTDEEFCEKYHFEYNVTPTDQ